MAALLKEVMEGLDGRIGVLDGSEEGRRPEDSFFGRVSLEEIDAVHDLDAEGVLALCDVVSNVHVDDLVDVDGSTQLHVSLVAVIAETKRSEHEVSLLPLTNLAFVAHLVDVSLQHHVILVDCDGRKRRHSHWD